MLTVIMPVYNGEDFLKQAVESVERQSHKDWELILVDDGSTDSSGQICDELAAGSDRIIALHKENEGLSSSRNAGLEIARGEMVAFIDCDDLLPPDALEKLSSAIELTGAQIACGRIHDFFGGPRMPKNKSSRAPREIEARKAVEDILYQRELNNSVCGKIFKRNLWQGLKFSEGLYYEDLDIFYKVFLKAEKVAAIDDIVYLYRQHDKSYVHTFNLQRSDMLKVTERLESHMAGHEPALLAAARSRRLSAAFNMLMLLEANRRLIGPEEKAAAKAIADKSYREIKRLRREALSNRNVRKKNKLGALISYIGGRRLLRLLAPIFY